jgi:hypothetical protein
MDRVIAAILTVASLGSHVAQVDETVKRYQAFLQRVSSDGSRNTPSR